MNNRKALELADLLAYNFFKLSCAFWIVAIIVFVISAVCLIILKALNINLTIAYDLNNYLQIALKVILITTLPCVICGIIQEEIAGKISDLSQQEYRRRYQQMTEESNENDICLNCKYFSNNSYLFCAVHPTMTSTVEYCKDWEQQ